MFTGLIEDVGRIARVDRSGANFRVTVAVDAIDTATLKLGESIAVNGVCTTVVGWDGGSFDFEASPETLSRTTLVDARAGQPVHLERAMVVGDRLGGHIVQGHVDGVGKLVSVEIDGNAWHLTLWAPPEVARMVVEKGSIAVDGVSLTVNAVDDARSTFRVTIVPHTSHKTLLTSLTPGVRVNLESDIIGKYVERLVGGYTARGDSPQGASRPLSLQDILLKHGYMGSDEGM